MISHDTEAMVSAWSFSWQLRGIGTRPPPAMKGGMNTRWRQLANFEKVIDLQSDFAQIMIAKPRPNESSGRPV